MPDYTNRKPVAQSAVPMWAMVILGTRLLGAFIGVIAMVVGIFMAIRVFSGIYTALTGPAKLNEAFNAWTRALGGKALDVVINNNHYPLAEIVTVLIMGVGAIVLAHLSITVMMAGMKMVQMAGGDLEQLKKALTFSGGPEPAEAERPYLGSKQMDPPEGR